MEKNNLTPILEEALAKVTSYINNDTSFKTAMMRNRTHNVVKRAIDELDKRNSVEEIVEDVLGSGLTIISSDHDVIFVKSEDSEYPYTFVFVEDGKWIRGCVIHSTLDGAKLNYLTRKYTKDVDNDACRFIAKMIDLPLE